LVYGLSIDIYDVLGFYLSLCIRSGTTNTAKTKTKFEIKT